MTIQENKNICGDRESVMKTVFEQVKDYDDLAVQLNKNITQDSFHDPQTASKEPTTNLNPVKLESLDSVCTCLTSPCLSMKSRWIFISQEFESEVMLRCVLQFLKRSQLHFPHSSRLKKGQRKIYPEVVPTAVVPKTDTHKTKSKTSQDNLIFIS